MVRLYRLETVVVKCTLTDISVIVTLDVTSPLENISWKLGVAPKSG